MTTEPKPVNCRCGRKATVTEAWSEYQVECTRSACWIGPIRKTRAAAVKAWNKVMAKP